MAGSEFEGRLNMNKSVEKLIHGLIVSCQAYDDTPLYGSDNMKLMAASALKGGAAGIRACWPQDIKAIRSLGNFPIIGINKIMKNDEDTKSFMNSIVITPDLASASEVVNAGADIIALDCTIRPFRNFDALCKLLYSIKDKYPDVAIMADISNLDEGIKVAQSGYVDIVSTTLSALNPDEDIDAPSYLLIRELKDHIASVPVNAEGRIWELEEYKKCLDAGADMVTIGTAITRPHLITKRFADCNNDWFKNNRL